MSRPKVFKEELELDEVLVKQQELQSRIKEFERSQKEIERTRAERECTIPPLDEIGERLRWRKHEHLVSRGEVANVRREQNQGLLLLLLLLAATAALVWWGLRLMNAA
jgi:prefoldin subunit 5